MIDCAIVPKYDTHCRAEEFFIDWIQSCLKEVFWGVYVQLSILHFVIPFLQP